MRKPSVPEVRQFLISHVEKIGLGVVLLLVAAALAGTHWKPYERSADELLQSVAQAEEQLQSAAWPDSERARFELSAAQHPRRAVDRLLFSAIPVSHYARLTPMRRHPLAAEQSLSEVKLRPVEDLQVKQGRVLVRLAPERLQRDGLKQSAEENQSEIQRPDSLLRREDLYGRKAEPAVHTPVAASEQGSLRGRAYPYLSVVGVFDVEAQVRDYMPAVRRNFRDSRELFEILDFQLQRQHRRDPAAPWSSWSSVDIDVLKDLIRSADGIAPDVVSADVTDSAITSPLPPRWTGVWAKTATHPRLSEYVLSPQDLEREMEFYRAVIDQSRRSLEEERRNRRGKGGFHEFVQDPRSVRRDFFATAVDAAPSPSSWLATGNPDAAKNRELDQLVRRLAREIDPENRDRELEEWIRRQARVQEHLLLFRYLDVDVEPGVTYRYRVRLEVRNPNYRKPLAAAGGLPHVVQGATRLTPWSEPTPPATVDELVHYFVTSVEPARSRLYPETRMNLFQYDLDLGTTVQHELDVMFGRAIGGTATARQVDPVRQIVEEKDYSFRSDDVLVDALEDFRFRPQDHAGLRLGGGSRGDAGLTPYALVVTRDGKLKTINAASQAAELERQTTYLGWQNAMATDYRDPARNDLERNSSDYDAIYRDIFDLPSAPQRSSKENNPLRRN